MQFRFVLICFCSILQASLSTPILGAKPKPVELKYSCVSVIDADHQDQRPDDVPIILLHGMGVNRDSFNGIFEILALDTRKKVCGVDLRNHGESPWNNDEYDTVAMTEDIKHFIDQIKAPKAIVLGHSLGGKVAVHLALNYPEKVEKVIVEDMRPNGVDPETLKQLMISAKIMQEVEKEMPQGVTEEEAKKIVINLINEKLEKLGRPKQETGIARIKCPDGKCRWESNSVVLDAFVRNIDELLNESSGQFDGPALFIYGGKSNFKVAEDESNIKKLFPNAKLVEVAEANHMVHKSKKFTTEVIKFINDK